MNILSQLTIIIADLAVLDPADIAPEHAFGSLGLDSLDHARLITQVEDWFAIEIPESPVCLTVEDLHQAVRRALNFTI